MPLNASNADIEQLPVAYPGAQLVPMGEFQGKAPISIGRIITLIGSGPESQIRLRSSTVSKRHALVLNANGGILIRDLGSRTGVLVNGQAVSCGKLTNGDRLQIGRVEFEVRAGEALPTSSQIAAPEAQISMPPDQVWRLDQPLFVIGRKQHCDMVLDDERVARCHAVIFRVEDSWAIGHVPESNETLLNGAGVSMGILGHGDLIEIAGRTLCFELCDRMAPAAASPPADEAAAPRSPFDEPADPTADDFPADDARSDSSLLPQLVQPASAPAPTAPAEVAPTCDVQTTLARPSSLPQDIPDWVHDAGGIVLAVALSCRGQLQEPPAPPPVVPPRGRKAWWIAAAILVIGATLVVSFTLLR